MADDRNPYQNPHTTGPGQHPTSGQYPAPGQYPASGQYPTSGQYPAPEQYPASGQYPAPGQNSGLEQYSLPGQVPRLEQMQAPPDGQGYIHQPQGSQPQGSHQNYYQPYYPQTKIPMSQDYASNYESVDSSNHRQRRLPIKHMDTFQRFSDESVRRAFIRKIYTVLTIQLSFTTGLISIFVLVDPVKEWVQKNAIMYFLAYGVFLSLYISLVCCEGLRRKYPTNYIFLFLLTVAMAYLIGVISCKHKTIFVFLAFAMTAALTLCITLFAIFTKMDFTKCNAFIVFISIAFIIFGFACFIVLLSYGPNKILSVVYAGVGLAVFSIFLCFDTQLIVGGRTHQYTEEEYIAAVLGLYLDIVYIFVNILTLLGLTDKN